MMLFVVAALAALNACRGAVVPLEDITEEWFSVDEPRDMFRRADASSTTSTAASEGNGVRFSFAGVDAADYTLDPETAAYLTEAVKRRLLADFSALAAEDIVQVSIAADPSTGDLVITAIFATDLADSLAGIAAASLVVEVPDANGDAVALSATAEVTQADPTKLAKEVNYCDASNSNPQPSTLNDAEGKQNGNGGKKGKSKGKRSRARRGKGTKGTKGKKGSSNQLLGRDSQTSANAESQKRELGSGSGVVAAAKATDAVAAPTKAAKSPKGAKAPKEAKEVQAEAKEAQASGSGVGQEQARVDGGGGEKKGQKKGKANKANTANTENKEAKEDQAVQAGQADCVPRTASWRTERAPGADTRSSHSLVSLSVAAAMVGVAVAAVVRLRRAAYLDEEQTPLITTEPVIA